MKYTFWLADDEKRSVLGVAARWSMNSKRGIQQHPQTAGARAKEDTDCPWQGLNLILGARLRLTALPSPCSPVLKMLIQF